MKKKSIRGIILRYICAFVFVASWTMLGIALAVNSAKVEMQGNVSFTATDVYAEVTGTVTGAKSEIDLPKLSFDADTKTFSTPSSWQNLDLSFANHSSDIAFTIKITNLSDERKFWVVITDEITTDNLNLTKKMDSVQVPAFYAVECNTLGTTTLEINMAVANKNKNVLDSFVMGVQLTTQQPQDGVNDYQGLEFTCNTTNHTAQVSPKNGNGFSGNVTIPSYVRTETGDVCFVTSMGDFTQSLFTSINCPDTITDMGDFYENGNIQSINIPKGVTKLSNYSFSCCTSLSSITFSDGLETIGDNAFEDCPSLTSIVLPSTLRKIGNSAFNCTGLESLIIPEGVTTIGECFIARTSITSIVIPGTVSTLEGFIFDGCTSLTSVTLNEGLQTISSYAFADTHLSSLIIPASVTLIEANAFGDYDFSFGFVPVSVTLKETQGWTIGGRPVYEIDENFNLNDPSLVSDLLNAYSDEDWIRS